MTALSLPESDASRRDIKPDPDVRGSGMTTKQMSEAPQGALFVWCATHTDYPRHLARKLGRSDLKIVSVQAVIADPQMYLAGRRRSLVVIDHAAGHLIDASPRACDYLCMMRD